ncbi:MAG: hypothetical protein MUC73_12015 [Cyclobacteriaceae bacterium]|nr:hypothetical protein [Cyclobacteriaceae bacterium]
MQPHKFFFLFFAVLNLILGMLTGLGRLGISVPLPEIYIHHGAIMVGGFLGSLIALEKVIPLKKKIFYIGPLLSGGSLLVFISGNFEVAVVLLILASLSFVLVYTTYLQRQFNMYLILAAMGACCWLVGNILLLWKRFYPMAFPWWMAFLLFTIVSERLELSRFLPTTKSQKNWLLFFIMLFTLGVLVPFHGVGTVITGLSLVLISVWLLRFDVIRITLKKKELVRFTAIALTTGYIALMLDGLFILALSDSVNSYDIIVHTFFLGFVFSMIFAHGPIILPGVLGLTVRPYHPLFYLPLILLLSSLLMRIGADALILPFEFRALSGWISMGSIILYFLLMITFTIRAFRHAKAD